ncbi:hypothetical protein GF340_01490 [Candidatus Peregrinibacteria bacterium]|nr:hypothetical protein [Candidatus Peregrinibacteria bacterium]
MFDKAKQLYQMQKKAKAIKKELQNTHIEAEEAGVLVIVNGEQEIIDIQIQDETLLQNAKKLTQNMIKALNKALKKAQQVAAEQMKDVMGNFNLPGM